MGELKRFSDIICGPTIAVHSSNNETPTPECDKRVKGPCPGSRDPVNCWALNANSFKMAKDTNFKFGRRAPRDSPHMRSDKYFRKVGVVTVT